MFFLNSIAVPWLQRHERFLAGKELATVRGFGFVGNVGRMLSKMNSTSTQS